MHNEFGKLKDKIWLLFQGFKLAHNNTFIYIYAYL